MIPINTAKIAFDPISRDLNHPADRRRFTYFAKTMGLNYEIYDRKKNYDIVILSETSDISLWRRSKKDFKIIFNLNDSYLSERNNIKSKLRGLGKFITRQNRFLELDFSKALQNMCLRADAVICSTDMQRGILNNYSDNIHLMFDAHFDEINLKKESYEMHKPFRLVWEGLPTNAHQLLTLSKLIYNSRIKEKIELHVVTDKSFYKFLNKYFKVNIRNLLKTLEIKTTFHEWTIENLQKVVINCDLGVIPINNKEPMMAGKPENKLLLMWRMALPVLVSSTPAYEKVMKQANQDNYIDQESEWIRLIEEFMKSPSKRRQAGVSGYNFVKLNYSKKEFINRWINLFNSLGYEI